MGKIKKSLPVKLISSIIYNNENLINNVLSELENSIGQIDFTTEPFVFNHTDYYNNEMGVNLQRRFIIFKELFNRDNIYTIKILTNQIEDKFSIENKRQINLDPGYISLENFILFTTKNYTHRIYLSSGIFADLTLIYENRQFNKLPWTYPDYASKEIRDFLQKIRDIYKNEIKEKGLLNESS